MVVDQRTDEPLQNVAHCHAVAGGGGGQRIAKVVAHRAHAVK